MYQQRWNDEKTALIIECFDWNDDCLEPNDSFTKLIQTYGTIQSISPSGEWALLAKPSSPTTSWPMTLVNMDTLEIRCTSSLPGTVFSTPLSCFQWTSDESTFTYLWRKDGTVDSLMMIMKQTICPLKSTSRGCLDSHSTADVSTASTHPPRPIPSCFAVPIVTDLTLSSTIQSASVSRGSKRRFMIR